MRQVGIASRRTGGGVKGWLLGLALLVGLAVLFTAPARGAGIRPHLPSLSHSGFVHACGDAVDSDGNLYVVDGSSAPPNPSTVTIYDPAGAPITTFSVGTAVCSLAVDANGSVYAAQSSGATFNGTVQKYSSSTPGTVTPATTFTLDGVIDNGPSKAVAVDPVTNDVYVSHPLRNETQTFALAGMTSDVTTFTVGNLPPACASSVTEPITFSSAAATRRTRIDEKLEKACSGGINDDFLLSGQGPTVTFQGQFASKDVPEMTCTPAAGTCTITTNVNGGISQISQYQSNGTLVTAAIGSGLAGANYSGLDVYGTNGRIFAFDGAHNQVAVFNPGAASPVDTFDGSTTPGGSIGAGLFGQGLAVDQATGHVYVFDRTHNVVAEFKADGEFVTQLTTPLVAADPADIAIDNSGGANEGTIYVADGTTVQAFGPMSYDDQLSLTVFKDGTGFGTVKGGSEADPTAIDCGATCDAEFDPDTQVTLVAKPDEGSIVAGWSGCDVVEGTENEICKFTMDANKTVTATFIQRILTVVKEGPGSATITSDPDGIDCGATCVANFPDKEVVSLTPSTPLGSKFKSWSGCDSVVGEVCEVEMDANRTVTATIGLEPTINSTEATSVGSTGATLKALLNPNGDQTSWHFEYVDDAEFQSNGFANAQKTPVPDFSAGNSATVSPVSRPLTGLTPETEYHFRLVATNFASPPGGTNGAGATFTTYAVVVPPLTCDNDSLRTGPSAKLPDCRAYEQASPVDKNGQDVLGRAGSMTASSDGNAVVYYALNGQPNGEGPQTFPVYLASRAAGEWSASGVLPPVSYGGDAAIRGWFPDLSTVFSRATDLNGSGVTTFLSRSSKDGALSTIATEGAGNFVGASADGSTVYFQGLENDDALAPNAVPGKPNLYAWQRGTNALTLAGVLPDSACGSPPCIPVQGSTVQGVYPVEDHAVSSEGGAYFSDIKTGQLYLRKDPFGSPSTVHVSASQRTDCAEDLKCGGDDEPDPDPQAPLPATFQTATPDGAHVFFTSPQELTDISNTGPNVDPPAIGRANSADGTGVVTSHIPLFDNPPTAMAADADHLYWLEPETNSIARADLDGQNDVDHEFIELPPIEVEVKPGKFELVPANPKGLAVGGGRIYWTSAADDLGHPFDISPGRIGRADLNGDNAASNVEPSCITNLRKPRGVDINTALGFVYWIGKNEQQSSRVGRADISDTCASADVSKDQSFVNPGGAIEPSDIAVSDNYIYISGTILGVGRLRRLNNIKDDANLKDYAFPADVGQIPLALDGSNLYWGASEAGVIGRSNLDLSSPNESFITGLTAPLGLTLGQGADAGHLYWTTGVVGGGRGEDLYRYDAASGDLSDLAPDDTTELGADVRGVLGASDDGDYVYFVANADLDGGGKAEPGDCTDVQVETDGSLTGTGQCSIYLAHDGETTFVARLEISSALPPFTDADNWTAGAKTGKAARVSGDGKTLLFRSKRELTGYDNQGATCAPDISQKIALPGPCAEIYRYNTDDGLSCVSCNPTGAPPNWPAQLTQIRPGNGIPNITNNARLRYLSADGNRIFFESADKLVDADTNGDSGCPRVQLAAGVSDIPACLDVYEWEAEDSGSCHSSAQNGGCLYLISSGTGSSPSFFLDASVSGDDAFFFTRDRLVPQDTDGTRDVYDASVGGGLDAQHAVPPAQCAGDACREGTSSSPGLPAAATTNLLGAGNQRSGQGKKPARCPKGKRKVRSGGKVRCVKRHHKKHKRTANNNRRASR